MPNTTRAAARRGFEFFMADPTPPSHEELNRRLDDDRLQGVSPRTYDHYRRLVRHGFRRYMPINELDMWVKSRHHPLAS